VDGENLEENSRVLSSKLRRRAYQAKPVKRVYIPKGDGRQRPLGVTVLEDKIVQRAVTQVLEAIYETDFKGFSYGFRPGRSAHDALDALAVGITWKKVNWVLDIDIRHRPRVAEEVYRAPDSGPACSATHTEVAQSRCVGRR